MDAGLIEAAERAVTSGRAPSVSAWVDEAMRLKVAHDQRMDALAQFVVAFENEHGEITPEEIRGANPARRSRSRLTRSRGCRSEKAGAGLDANRRRRRVRN